MADSVQRVCDEFEVCREEAIFYLEGFGWNSNAAREACGSQTLSLPSLKVKNSPRVNDSCPPRSREEATVLFKKVAVGTTDEEAVFYLERCNWNANLAVQRFLYENQAKSSQRKLTIGGSNSAQVKSGSSSFSPMEVDPADSHDEDGDEHIPEAIPLMASSRAKMQKSEQPSQLDNEEQLIRSFRDVAVGATREEAIHYLESFNWDVDQAVCSFLEGFSEEETSSTLSMSSMRLPSQSQFQASYTSQNQGCLKEGKTGSSRRVAKRPCLNLCSSIDADPTETGNATLAIPGIASSQVDENLKDYAFDQDLSTVLFPDPIDTTIELEIKLADGGSWRQVWIPLRPDETVRDIRNRVEEFRPAGNRDYYFMSDTGEEYRDLDTTVHMITSRGSTTLCQSFST